MYLKIQPKKHEVKNDRIEGRKNINETITIGDFSIPLSIKNKTNQKYNKETEDFENNNKLTRLKRHLQDTA